MSRASLLFWNPQRTGLILGPVIALVMLLVGPPGEVDDVAWRVAACMVWMAVWWIFEATPVAVTALLPIVLFPLLDVGTIRQVTAPYAHPIIFLFLGGFLLALAIERWHLHKRFALAVLLRVGGSASRLIGGFMLVAALLSMWISNTATTIMLLPMGLAINSMVEETLDIDREEKRRFTIALLLSIAYAATLGGVATLIGTPPNTLMAGYLQEQHGIEVGFANWLLVGLPMTFLLLPVAWWLLTRWLYRVDFNTREARRALEQMQHDLGPMSAEEKRVLVVFVLTALCWATRPILNNLPGLGNLHDSIIAIAAGISLFVIGAPSEPGQRLLRWSDTSRLPWGILVLFGGGLSLAWAVGHSGLAETIGNSVTSMGIVNTAVLVFIVATLVIFFTEITGNLSVTATFLPIVGAIAVSMQIDPVILIVPVAMAASCAFMLPVSTPPNAIVYGSGAISIPQMARAGIWLNIASIIVVSLISIFLVPAVLLSVP